MLDIFNPNNWPLLPPHEFKIYGDDNAQTWCTVDEEDYHFLIQWRWGWKTPNKKNQGNRVPKPYMCRKFETQIESPYKAGGTYINPETGREVRHRKPRLQQDLMLHIVVMRRTGIIPPDEHHHIVDHLDGDQTNCRRFNLRWATSGMNRNNLLGKAAKEMQA